MKHILIDFENIQPTSLDSVDDPKNTQIWLFLGVHQQKTLPYPLTKSLFRFPSSQVHFIELQRTGKNALDHYLAFYLGKISELDHNAQVCILAKDGGYDILVEHLNATHKGLQIQRLIDLQTFIGIENKQHSPALIDVLPPESAEIKPPITAKIIQQTEEERTYSQLMATAYQQVFRQIKIRLDNQDFIPTKKTNFLSALQKYFLADLLKDMTNDEQFLFAQKLFARLQNYGLIKLRADSNTLIYQFSPNELRENVANSVLVAKPKTLEKLKNVLKSHMALLQMPKDETALTQMVQWLTNKAYIYQEKEKISYEPPIKTAPTQPTPPADGVNQENINKAVAVLKGKFAKNRPNKPTALCNILINHLKITKKQAEQLISDLEKSKKITIPPQGKISYQL